MTATCDVLVIGAGIAGLSAAAALAPRRRVVVLERESAPGYHTSGRSAAQYSLSLTSPTVRRLAQAGRTFFEAPPAGFADHPIATPRISMSVGRVGQEAVLRTEAQHEGIRWVEPGEAARLFPPLSTDGLCGAIVEEGARDLDVHAMLQGHVRGLRAAGGTVVHDAEVLRLERRGGLWRAETKAGAFAAPVVVDAAGAWADEVARLAGVHPLGLVPKRRTAFVFDPPAGIDPRPWAFAGDLDETWYVKPETGRFMGSLSDATPSPPCDAQPEEIDVAQAIDNIERATSLRIRRPQRTWAGLRSFVADGDPVAGFAPDAEGFFWLAGQGGVGFLTSPALSRAAAALVEGGDLPEDLRALGLAARDLAPSRLA
jgi:D-arginine dehydrogenase